MVAWFVIAVGTLALFAFIAVQGVSTVDAMGETNATVQTVRILDTAVAGVLRRSSAVDGSEILYLPAGQQTPAGYTLPADMTVQSHLPTGGVVLYCPFGGPGTSGTAQTVTSPSGSNYSVGLAAFQNRTYVVSGRPAIADVATNPNLLGFMVAPVNRFADPVSCASVTRTSTGAYSAAGAIVRPIMRTATADVSDADRATGNVFYVSTAGGGRGTSVSDPASINAALGAWRASTAGSYVLYLAPGAYQVEGSLLDGSALQPKPANASLTIVGLGAGASISVGGTVAPPSDLVLQNVTLPTNVALVMGGDGRRLLLRNATVGPVRMDSGTLDMQSNVSIVDGKGVGAALDLRGDSNATAPGSTVSFTSAANGFAVAVQDTARFTASQGTINIAGNSAAAFLVAPGARFVGSTVNVYQTGSATDIFRTLGSTTLQNATVFVSAGVGNAFRMGDQSSLDLIGVSVGGGVLPAYGIVDSLTSKVQGHTVAINAATRCWSSAGAGSPFSQSSQGSTGALSPVTADETPPAMDETPTAAQINAYNEASRRNADRAAARRFNKSEYTCSYAAG